MTFAVKSSVGRTARPADSFDTTRCALIVFQ